MPSQESIKIAEAIIKRVQSNQPEAEETPSFFMTDEEKEVMNLDRGVDREEV